MENKRSCLFNQKNSKPNLAQVSNPLYILGVIQKSTYVWEGHVDEVEAAL